MARPLDPAEPSKWQVENKGGAKEPFNRAAEGRPQKSNQQTGKVSETVRRDRPHMAPRPEGSLRRVETSMAYGKIAREGAKAQNAQSAGRANSKKAEVAERIAKNLQKEGGMENNKNNGRSDGRDK